LSLRFYQCLGLAFVYQSEVGSSNNAFIFDLWQTDAIHKIDLINVFVTIFDDHINTTIHGAKTVFYVEFYLCREWRGSFFE
jgi:hypothetical protein